MTSYIDLDPVIVKWVERLGSALFTDWAGAPARFFHIPGDPPFEAFQISVEATNAERTSVHARAVDTNDDTESALNASWEGTPAELDSMLASAVKTVEEWRVRVRRQPDPKSPW